VRERRSLGKKEMLSIVVRETLKDSDRSHVGEKPTTRVPLKKRYIYDLLSGIYISSSEWS